MYAAKSSDGSKGSSRSRAQYNSTEQLPLEDELKVALGLLLKHRGGPGFGHGRLQGSELNALELRLRSVTNRLTAEAAAAAGTSAAV